MDTTEVSNVKRPIKKIARPVVSVSYDLDMSDPTRPDGPHCPIHPETALICPACIAAKGGRSTSPAKLKALERNRKLAVKAATKARNAKRKGRLFDFVCRTSTCPNRGNKLTMLQGIRHCERCKRRMARV